jgi:hypothetical protein
MFEVLRSAGLTSFARARSVTKMMKNDNAERRIKEIRIRCVGLGRCKTILFMELSSI